MSKQSLREEAERLIRESMEKKTIVVKQGTTRIEAVCGKCGAPNRVQAERAKPASSSPASSVGTSKRRCSRAPDLTVLPCSGSSC